MLLEIKDLRVQVDGTDILKGINLSVKAGEVHAIMGPNGSGKSTLGKVLAGHPSYQIVDGSITYTYTKKKMDLIELAPEKRAQLGVFLGLQYPTEIPGVSNLNFLRESFNEICKAQGASELDPYDFKCLIEEKMKVLQMKEDFLLRSVNSGFSGGEKKKNEILQLLLLNPFLAILDETDSGLDVDALKVVAYGINQFKSKYNATILITHYQRLLDYAVPDYVHILENGRIVETGDATLAQKVESTGYTHLPKTL